MNYTILNAAAYVAAGAAFCCLSGLFFHDLRVLLVGLTGFLVSIMLAFLGARNA